MPRNTKVIGNHLSQVSQPLAAKVAEITFRRDLCLYRVSGEPLFTDEYDGEAIVEIFKTRIADALADVDSLPERPVLQNCLEIGAECCQRIAAIGDHLDVPCYAADISLDSLLSLPRYAPKIGTCTIPFRVCCDITVLPFRSDSIDLVMAYQTLHHFMKPTDVVSEVHRVNRRTFVGCDEPTRRYLQLPIGMQRFGIYSAERRAKGRYRRLIEDFFFEPRTNEVAYGVTENEKMSLKNWRDYIEPWYDCRWFNGRSVATGQEILTGPWNSLKWSIHSLTGSSISFVGRKIQREKIDSKLRADLICPDCLSEFRLEYSLARHLEHYTCTYCRTRFPTVQGVAMLLPTKTRSLLYPSLRI
jgi:ubiquinone/menaquinone biosynthesis C-methylase UbiE/uncharacterized protein YbaR (Trm112 family)